MSILINIKCNNIFYCNFILVHLLPRVLFLYKSHYLLLYGPRFAIMMVGIFMNLMVLVCLIQVQGQTQENFKNLFNSIIKNDKQKISISEDILRQKATKEQEVFASMKSALQIPKRRIAINYKNLARYRRDGIISSPAASEYIECACITQNEVFQAVFRNPSTLLPFLNEVLSHNFPNVSKLTNVEIQAEEDMNAEGKLYIFLDVCAWGDDGNFYVIKMERTYQPHDTIRFQYIASRIYDQLIRTRYKTMSEAAKRAAEEKTVAAKIKAKEAAKKKAEAANAESQEVAKAMEKTAKAVEEIRPKLIQGEDLYTPNNVSTTVIVIIIVEEGMPVREFGSQFTRESYTLVTSLDEFWPHSIISYIHIDLTRFAHIIKLENLRTPLDYWCSFLWHAKDKRIEKKLLQKLQKFPGIQEAVRILESMPTLEMMKYEAKQREEETMRESARVEEQLDLARKLLKKNMDDATILEMCAKISADQLEELKSSLYS